MAGDYSNKGKLFLYDNDYRKGDNHPVRTGTGEISKSFLKELIEIARETPGDLIEVQCASWERVSKKGKAYTFVSFEKKYVKPEAATVDASDLSFD